MKVVVSGGSGLIGRALVASLIADDHDVHVLSRRPARARARLPKGVHIHGWHADEASMELALLLANATAVVNLCGASIGRWPWTTGRRRELRDSRLVPTATLVEAMASLPPSERPAALLNASGSDVYEGRDERPADEHTEPVDTFLARLCRDWEAAAGQAQALDVRVVLLRPGLVIGRGAPALARLTLPLRLFAGGSLGSGRQWISWVAIDDAVGLLRRAIAGWDISGPLNLAAPEPIQQRNFVHVLARVMRRPAWLSTPAWLLRLLLGEQQTLVLGSRRLIPAKALGASYEFRVPDLEKALALALGPPPPTVPRAG